MFSFSALLRTSFFSSTLLCSLVSTAFAAAQTAGNAQVNKLMAEDSAYTTTSSSIDNSRTAAEMMLDLLKQGRITQGLLSVFTSNPMQQAAVAHTVEQLCSNEAYTADIMQHLPAFDLAPDLPVADAMLKIGQAMGERTIDLATDGIMRLNDEERKQLFKALGNTLGNMRDQDCVLLFGEEGNSSDKVKAVFANLSTPDLKTLLQITSNAIDYQLAGTPEAMRLTGTEEQQAMLELMQVLALWSLSEPENGMILLSMLKDGVQRKNEQQLIGLCHAAGSLLLHSADLQGQHGVRVRQAIFTQLQR